MQKKPTKCKKNLVGIIFLVIFAQHKQQHKLKIVNGLQNFTFSIVIFNVFCPKSY